VRASAITEPSRVPDEHADDHGPRPSSAAGPPVRGTRQAPQIPQPSRIQERLITSAGVVAAQGHDRPIVLCCRVSL
jgi:hypothetical protein